MNTSYGKTVGRYCGVCRFYEEIDDGGNGMCRKYAPRLVLPVGHDADTSDSTTADWPCVAECDWCGEFELDGARL